MKLISFEVIGLFGKDEVRSIQFNEDINIVTGRNGSGKTSVLKLMWYIMSGNILLALREVNFRKAVLITDEYECTVYRLTSYTCKIELKVDGTTTIFEDREDQDGDVVSNAEDRANPILQEHGGSVFLPTFRRIEGGFTINERTNNFVSRAKGDVEESLVSLSKRLTNGRHVFVASLSTTDIVSLLVKKYTELSEEYNGIQEKTSQDIIGKIKRFDTTRYFPEQPNNTNAIELLGEIRTEIEGMEEKREGIMRPLEAVRELAIKLFKHSGIKLGKSLSFGDAANAVNSEELSAGEKQMLSFIAYNAFYQDSVVIIDEPELSLHVDWQRQLFPILRGQHSSNQFVIATHSPFIYGKYPDKEIQIDPERGDEEGV